MQSGQKRCASYVANGNSPAAGGLDQNLGRGAVHGGDAEGPAATHGQAGRCLCKACGLSPRWLARKKTWKMLVLCAAVFSGRLAEKENGPVLPPLAGRGGTTGAGPEGVGCAEFGFLRRP